MVWKTIGITVAIGLLAGCAGQPVPAVDHKPQPSSEAARLPVPAVVAMRAADADAALIKAGLIPILRYEPGVLTGNGTVVNTDPPAGTRLSHGDLVTVVVAGSPGATLHEYVDAHRERFVGVGSDANGVLVVGVHQSANLQTEMPRLTQLAGARQFRVQTCVRSWAELRRVQVSLSVHELLQGASFATSIDPLACAVRFTGNLSDAQVAALTAKFAGALVIQKGEASRLG